MSSAAGSITRVARPSFETRENSIGSLGPSSRKGPAMGSDRGSHSSDPQPMQPIFRTGLRTGVGMRRGVQPCAAFEATGGAPPSEPALPFGGPS